LEPIEDKPRVTLERRKRGPKKHVKTKAELELSLMSPRMRDLAEGRLKVEDLDWEELMRGQIRDKNGNFTGAKPAILPRSWHDRIAGEIVKGAEAQFRENYDMTMKVLIDLVANPRTPARERLAAVQYMQERVIGKITEKREIKTEVTVFEEMVSNGAFLVDLGEVDDDGS
jgi:hypothetical protein